MLADPTKASPNKYVGGGDTETEHARTIQNWQKLREQAVKELRQASMELKARGASLPPNIDEETLNRYLKTDKQS